MGTSAKVTELQTGVTRTALRFSTTRVLTLRTKAFLAMACEPATLPLLGSVLSANRKIP